MKIYTKTGDDGQTGLFGGQRLRKDDPRVEAYGTVDELNACLGMVRAESVSASTQALLERLQNELFVLGAELACKPGHEAKLRMNLLDDESISELEKSIDQAQEELTPLQYFVLPAGSRPAAALHFARTVCRRAERRCLSLPELRPALLIYLNRLSDLLFCLARLENHRSETEETPWRPR